MDALHKEQDKYTARDEKEIRRKKAEKDAKTKRGKESKAQGVTSSSDSDSKSDEDERLILGRGQREKKKKHFYGDSFNTSDFKVSCTVFTRSNLVF